MPIADFNGDTFVAFIDICGFRELLKDEKRAWQALDRFYQLGYDVLNPPRQANNTSVVEGMFVSDCGILFVRGDNLKIDEKLTALLDIVKKINDGMLQRNVMLTTSIAYGPFRYQQRIEFQGIEKNPVYGNAYLGAYLDGANEKPPIQPGQCRIVINNLPDSVIVSLDGRQGLFSKIRKESNKHYYFYWNVENPEEIEPFTAKYHDAYNLKFAGMLKALKGENG